jgi:uncharacterized delta-60 repeat protein
MNRWISRLAALALPCVTWFAAMAAPGDWDTSFAQAGRLPFTLPGVTFSVRDWVQQPDGKVIVVGHTTGVNSTENNDYVVARFNLDGTPDASFDGDGYRQFDFGSTVIGLIELERQTDGKLLIAGQAGPGSGDVHLLRLTTGGAPDPGYGLGGEVTISLANNGAYANPALKLAANGDAIVVSGFSTQTPAGLGNIAVTRVTTAGAIDTSFGSAGTAYLQSNDHLFSYLLDVAADGKIVVAGEKGPYNNQVPIVARLTSTGQPDASFGTGGLVVLPFLAGNGFSSAIAAAPNGAVVFAGERQDGNGSDVWFLGRLLNSGVPDPAFGSGGRVILDRGGIKSLAVESDGKIVVAGYSGVDPVGPSLSRYDSDGAPDVAFGLRGTRITDFSTGNVYAGGELSRLHRNADATYTALVTTMTANLTNSFALARFVAQGTNPGVIGIRAEFEDAGSPGHVLVYEDTPVRRFHVYRTGGSDGTVSVQYRTVSGTATAGQDFVAKTGTVTFNDGETDASFDVEVIDDPIPEPNFSEQFEVELFAPTGGAILSKQRATIEIMPDSDWGQRIELYGAGTVLENTTARFLVNRTGDMRGPLTLNYTITPISATAGSDYAATSGSVQWTADQGGFKEFTVPIVNDSLAESSEDFRVSVADPNGVAAPMFVETTIVDNDNVGPATIAFAANAVFVNESAGTATLTVYRLGDATQALSVPWSIATGSAGENTDFVPSSGTLTWNAGQSGSKTISIPLVNDSTYEALEVFSAGLDAPVGVTVAGTPYATIYIEDDDGTPSQPVFSIGPDMTVNESAGTISIPVTLTGTPDKYVGVNFNGTHESTNGNDASIGGGTLIWPPGESGTRMITVPIFNDSRDELDETFSMSISRPSDGGSLGNAQMRVTIVDNDPTPAGQPAPVAPGIRVTSSNVTVGEDQRTVRVDVERVGDTSDWLTVFYAAADGTASSPVDFVVPGSQIGWAPGESGTRHVELQINGDSVAEPTETFTLNFVTFSIGPTGPVVSVPITITDDDAPVAPARVGFTSATKSVSESATSVTLQVSRTGNTSGASSVDYSTVAGTAGTSDFTASTGTLTWAANDAAPKSITIALSPDSIDETDETFVLNLGNPSSGTELDAATATVTIQDDDLPPPPLPAHVAVANVAQSVAESATSVAVSVSRTGNTTGTSSVDYATAPGTAGASDFTAASGTLTWAANDTAPKSITITLLADTTDEPDETFTVTLSNPSSGTTLDAAMSTVTITDDDATPPPPPVGGGAASSGGGGKGGGSESALSLLALASLLLVRNRKRRLAAR